MTKSSVRKKRLKSQILNSNLNTRKPCNIHLLCLIIYLCITAQMGCEMCKMESYWMDLHATHTSKTTTISSILFSELCEHAMPVGSFRGR